MSFKIASRFYKAALVVNSIPIEKFPLILNRIFQKLHLKGVKFFSEEEENQLKDLFELSTEELSLVLNCCCYIFEQAAFTSTGPEPLFNILVEAGFEDTHAKAIGRIWAAEAGDYVGKLKEQTLGFPSVVSINHHMDMILGQKDLSKQQDPTALFEFEIASQNGITTDNDKFGVEFSHPELFSFFQQLDRVQKQLDGLGSTKT